MENTIQEICQEVDAGSIECEPPISVKNELCIFKKGCYRIVPHDPRIDGQMSRAGYSNW